MKRKIFNPLYFLIIIILFIPTILLNSQETNLNENILGIWKYIIYSDSEGSNLETNQARYGAVKNIVYAMKYNANGTAEPIILKDDDNEYTDDNEKITSCTWSITSNKLTLNYEWVPSGEYYQDIYDLYLENDNKNALCVLVSTTHPDRTSLTGKYKIYCEKL